MVIRSPSRTRKISEKWGVSQKKIHVPRVGGATSAPVNSGEKKTQKNKMFGAGDTRWRQRKKVGPIYRRTYVPHGWHWQSGQGGGAKKKKGEKSQRTWPSSGAEGDEN